MKLHPAPPPQLLTLRTIPGKTLTIIVDKCGGGWSSGLKNSYT